MTVKAFSKLGQNLKGAISYGTGKEIVFRMAPPLVLLNLVTWDPEAVLRILAQ